MAASWKDEYAIGIPAIDAQHKELCDAVDRLLEASKSGKGKDETKKIMVFLEQYVVKHFTDEESIQKQNGYPGYVTHAEIHQEFKKTFATLKQEAEAGDYKLSVIMKINHAALFWLINHIGGEDRKIAAFIKQKASGK